MRVKRPRVLGSAEGQEATGTAVLSLDTHHRRLEPLGVTLAEVTQRLSPLQRPLRHHPVATVLDPCATGAAGGTLLTRHAHASRSWRPWLGPYPRDRPRLEQGAGPRPQPSAGRPWSARLPGSLGPGQVATACGKVDAVASAIAPCNEPEARGTHRGKARSEWRRSLGYHGHCIPHDGPRERNGEAIAPGGVAATVTQVVRKRFWKKQPRQWAKSGAHWLLQTRVQTLDGEVGALLFKRWYPDLDIAIEKRPVAA